MSKISILFTLVALATFSMKLSSQNYIETQKLQLEESIQDQIYPGELGKSISMDGNTAIVGSPSGGLNDNTSGFAVIYEFNSMTSLWEEITIIFADDRESLDEFGYSVSISGDLVIVGAPSQSNSGAAYIFERDQGGSDNWGLVKKCTPSDGTMGQYGNSVAIDGDVAIVGTYFGTAAYVYDQNWGGANNWGEVKKLQSDTPFTDPSFGYDVDINQGFAAVTAPIQFSFPLFPVAFIFSRDQGGPDNWGQIKELNTEESFTGFYLSMSDNRLIVGDGSDDYFLYDKDLGGVNNWGFVQEIETYDGNSQSFPFFFGDILAIGRPDDVINGIQKGSVRIYREDYGGPGAWGEVSIISAGDGFLNDRFGTSIGYNGDMLLVGAPQDDDQGIDSGGTYIFEQDNNIEEDWTQMQKLSSGTGLAGQGNDQTAYGYSVSISGNTAIVGSIGLSSLETGAVSIYYKDMGAPNQWTKVKNLYHPSATERTNFGHSVSIDGDVCIVSDYRESVFVFMKDEGGIDNWGEVAELFPESSSNITRFGYSLEVSSDWAIVGAQTDGEVHIYGKDIGGVNNWGLVKNLSLPTQSSDYFGWSVSIDNSQAIIGAFLNDDLGTHSGAAYIYNKDEGGPDNWGLFKTIYASDPSNYGTFGREVDIKDNRIVVAGNKDAYIFERDQGGSQNWGEVKKLTFCEDVVIIPNGSSVSTQGDLVVIGSALNNAVHIFSKDTGGTDNWGQYKKITSSDAEQDDYFGISAAIEGDALFVGARQDNDQGTHSGSAYIFTDCGLPQIVCPEDIIIEVNDMCQAEDFMVGQATVTDLCNSEYDITNDAPELFPIGETVINWSVNNCTNDLASCQSIVTVRDNEDPIVLCNNMEVLLDNDGNASISVSDIDNGSTDNCGIQSLNLDTSTFNCDNIGTNILTLIATDIHGNTETCEAIIKVIASTDMIGLVCDDNDPCTISDVFISECNCQGQQTRDSDFDGFCDLIDICNGFDDSIDLDGNGIPDGCDCQDLIIEDSEPIMTISKKASIGIETNGKVISLYPIEYSAGNYIELTENFQVLEGAIFEAKIEICE